MCWRFFWWGNSKLKLKPLIFLWKFSVNLKPSRALLNYFGDKEHHQSRGQGRSEGSLIHALASLETRGTIMHIYWPVFFLLRFQPLFLLLCRVLLGRSIILIWNRRSWVLTAQRNSSTNLVMSVASGWRKALRMRMGIEGSYGCLLGLCLKLTGSRFYPDTLKSVKNLFPDIFKTMHASYLERNPLIIQRQNN